MANQVLILAADPAVTILPGEDEVLSIVGGVDTLLIVDGTVGPAGPQGPAGAPGGSAYEHTQSVAASTWIITHNLGRGVHVTLRSPDGEYIESDVVASSVNVTTVNFPSPVTGSAVIS